MGGEDAGLVIASQNVWRQLIVSTFYPAFGESKSSCVKENTWDTLSELQSFED